MQRPPGSLDALAIRPGEFDEESAHATRTGALTSEAAYHLMRRGVEGRDQVREDIKTTTFP